MPSSLAVLIRHSTPYRGVSSIEPTSIQLRHLEALAVATWTGERALVRTLLTQAKEKLRVFGLIAPQAYDQDIRDMFGQGLLQHVEILCLSFWLEDSDCHLIAQSMPALSELHLVAGRISKSCIRSLVAKQGVPLRKMAGCCTFMEEGAAELAQANGITLAMQTAGRAEDGNGFRSPPLYPTQPSEILATFKAVVEDLNLAPKF